MNHAVFPTLGSAVYALACKECRSAQRALASRKKPHQSVHSARKAIRRLRAVLLLANDRFDEIGIADKELRRIGSGLSRLRDAYVITSAARVLAEKDDHGRWQPAIDGLERRCEELLSQAMASDPDFARRRARLQRVVERLQSLPWPDLGNKDISAAIERSAKRVRKAHKRACNDESPENIHRWRRRTRRLRMQLEAVKHLRVLTAHSEKNGLDEFASGKEVKGFKKLADRLGWYQDLQVLSRILRRLPLGSDLPILQAQLKRAIAAAEP